MDFKGRRVLVTGGAGFVGSNIVRRLSQDGAQITVLDDLFTGKVDNLPKSPAIVFVEGTVLNPVLVDELVSKTEIVIHAAARNIIVSTKNPLEDYQNNIGGTLNVLMAAKKYRSQRVVYTSSASIYGNARYLPINEDDSYNLLSPYAVSKFAGENYATVFYESYGISTSVVRYSNVYGLNQRPDNPYCGVVAKFFESAMSDQPICIHGDGEQTRDFTFVEDAVDATLQAAYSEKAEGKVYNVATGRETSINGLARFISELYGRKNNITYVDRRDIDNVRRRVLNIERIRKELRWIPTVTLEAGLQLTKKWLEVNLNK